MQKDGGKLKFQTPPLKTLKMQLKHQAGRVQRPMINFFKQLLDLQQTLSSRQSLNYHVAHVAGEADSSKNQVTPML
jgi:hypothetical protein